MKITITQEQWIKIGEELNWIDPEVDALSDIKSGEVIKNLNKGIGNSIKRMKKLKETLEKEDLSDDSRQRILTTLGFMNRKLEINLARLRTYRERLPEEWNMVFNEEDEYFDYEEQDEGSEFPLVLPYDLEEEEINDSMRRFKELLNSN